MTLIVDAVLPIQRRTLHPLPPSATDTTSDEANTPDDDTDVNTDIDDGTDPEDTATSSRTTRPCWIGEQPKRRRHRHPNILMKNGELMQTTGQETDYYRNR